MKSLEHNDKSHKLQKILLSLYKDCHYSLQALRELRDLSQALAKKVSRPLNFLGAWWLPHLQTALTTLFIGLKVFWYIFKMKKRAG